VLEDSNRPGGKEPFIIYNFYLRFYCLTLLETNSYILFTVANVKGPASILVGTIVDLKDLRWVIPCTHKRV